jgi:hypothetical protein
MKIVMISLQLSVVARDEIGGGAASKGYVPASDPQKEDNY